MEVVAFSGLFPRYTHVRNTPPDLVVEVISLTVGVSERDPHLDLAVFFTENYGNKVSY